MTKNRSFLGVALGTIFVLLACVVAFCGCSAPKTESISIQSGYIQAQKIGGTWDTTGLVVCAHRADGSSTLLSADQYSVVSTPSTAALGVQTVGVKYTEAGQDYYASAPVYIYGDLISIEIVEGSCASIVNKNANYDTASLRVIASYECVDGAPYTRELADDLAISSIDTTAVGVQTLVVSYTEAGISRSTSMNVEIKKDYTIWAFDEPSSISTEYRVNSQRANTFDSSSSTGTKGYEITSTRYQVGSYNKFFYQPTLKVVYDGTTSTEYIQDFPMTATVYEWVDDQYVELTGAALNDTVTFDRDEHWFLFSPAAQGHQYKLSVYPAGTLEPAEIQSIQPLTLEIDVVDGYNVYTAADLSAIDNANIGGKWTALKNQWMSAGLTNGDITHVTTSTFILHNNISIQNTDIPSVHFYTAEEVSGAVDAAAAAGSLKDSSDVDAGLGAIYKRVVASGSSTTEGQTFGLLGNYFTISAQDLALIYRESDSVRTDATKGITTHTALFAIVGSSPMTAAAVQSLVDAGAYPTFASAQDAVSPKSVFENVSLLGNTQKSDDALLSGGVIFSKNKNIQSTYRNCLSQKWFISFMTERTGTALSRDGYLAMTIDQTNAFDAYNTMLYNWGGSLIVRDSHLIGAGGPVLIADHAYEAETDGTSSPCDVSIDAESVLESKVAGSEGWFETYPAASTLMGAIKAQNVLFRANGKTFTIPNNSGVDMLNIVAVLKAGSAADATSTPIQAKCTIEGLATSLQLAKADTYLEILDKVVVTNILANSDADALAAAWIASVNPAASKYVAIEELIALAEREESSVPAALETFYTHAQTIKSSYDAAYTDPTTRATVSSAVSQGIVYVGANGLVCMPGNDGSWAIAPNADLLAEATGYMHVYVYGTLGAVITIDDYTTPAL